MIFKEIRWKRMLNRFKNPQWSDGKKYVKITILMVILTIIAAIVIPRIAGIFLIVTGVFMVLMLKKVNINMRSNQILQIKDGMIIIDFDAKEFLKRKEHCTHTLEISKLEGIEYFEETGEIAFLTWVDFGACKMYGCDTENIYAPDLLEYLKQEVMEVQYISKGNFASRWRK